MDPWWERVRHIPNWLARSGNRPVDLEEPTMDNSVYQARWLLGPLFVFCFAFVGVGLMAS